MHPIPFNRRSFVISSAAAGAALLGARRPVSAALADKVRVGVIGIGGRGMGSLVEIEPSGGSIVALCDVDERRGAEARSKWPTVSFEKDFRKLLDRKDIDALLVATPDHTHFPAAALGLDAGKHVYCEKPLTHTVEEARILRNLAAAKGLQTQMGTQIHSGDNYRRVVEIIQSGLLGDIKDAHVWCSKSWGGNGRQPAAEVVPEGLDYDLWLGAIQPVPYSKEYVPFNWRKYWAFGGGTLADMGCHFIDLVYWSLNLDLPTRVAAEGTPVSEFTAATELTAHWDFAARDGRKPVKLHWYDGGRKPPVEGMLKWDNGVLFVGEKGMLQADYGRYAFLPQDKFAGVKLPEPSIARSKGHWKEWLLAIKGEGKPLCSFDYSAQLTETVLLGTVAYRAGTAFNWDARNFQASEPAAQALIAKTYREGWSEKLSGFKQYLKA
ncbi:MAG: gfo/Idh/MocA family oxidoreductase [Planctomycetota bacterium]|nr:MAG: gfo/Idh/MocA family oxidoreductase [Planctomycetota bacterium]